ncbi:MAG: hypothetical protein ASARMPREDX12_006369 [Alectoria sarmentosa]|nr:MAG: hypothetical protein ASARMPREDX12_006369 [Alectoria sarmentosa]
MYQLVDEQSDEHLLEELEIHIKHGLFSLCTIAAHDRLFLQHDLHLVGITKSVEKLADLVYLINALLARLQDGSSIRRNRGLAGDPLSGELNCDKFVANIQHVLWSLRQNALAAIIRYCLNLDEVHILHWHLYWQHSKRIGEGWFAEWPNGHRPLNTTWPWNIKPSLFVLWGVCWMFYGPSGDKNRRPTRNADGAAQLGGDLRTGPLGGQSQPSPQQSISLSSRQQNYDFFTDNTGIDSTEAWAGPASNTYPNYSWLHPTQAGVARRASNDDITGVDRLPTSVYATSVPSYPYISAPSNSPSNLYPTSTVTWPYCQGINPVPSPAYAPNYTPWQTQSPFDPATSVATTPQRTGRSSLVQPYAQRIQTANTGNPQVATGSLGSLGFGLGLHMSDMQDYPSPGSSTSGQTTSSYVPVLPPNVLSPSMPLMPSPSMAESTGSRQSSRRSQEAPRNAEGLLYCDHAEHAQQQPPVFSRKKHMDKHERPFVCKEPECENIRGFTYSGGLLRHQREVHRQHGGPKASCMCPYPDCKRHVGVGFSRKENLAEHLRRVHREAGADQTQKEASEGAQNMTSGASRPGRKRRRAVPDDGGGDGGGEEDLEQEVKKLKKELQEKDERLEKLERQVQVLMKGQKQ